MKQLRIATTCLLMLLVAHQRTIAADTLHIECNTKAIKKFLRNDLTKANTTCVVLSGYDKRTNWNKVFKKLGTLPALSELMLLSNNLNKLPESAVALKKLEHLTVIGSSDAWLEESIDVLLRMNALHHLTCELEYEDELPFELLHAPTLRQVTCISPMFEDFHIGWQKALSDTGLYIYSINLERTGDLQSIGPLSVSIIWPDAPEDEDAMQAVEVAADETANGESTAEDQTATSALKDDDAEFVAATRISAPTNGFDPEYKTLHRPVPDIDTPREYYAVDCSKRTVIFTERSNTQIDIPANAFVDKQGNAVQGDVQVDYREFRDPVDFLFSGIPMSFGDSTNQTFFRSAGMFEINASQNGNEVFLQDDKDITVNFADTDTASIYNFYEYDDAYGTWKDNGEAPPAVQGVLLPNSKKKSIAYQNFISAKNKKKHSNHFDTTTYHNRFADMKYENCNLITEMKFRGNRRSIHNQISVGDSKIKLYKVRRSRSGYMVFDMKNYTRLNDEVKKLGASHWMLVDKANPRTFRKVYGGKNEYTDIRITPANDGYLLTLKNKKKNDMMTLEAKPVKLVKDHLRRSYPDQQVNYKAYKKRLDQKQKRYDKLLLKMKKREDRWLKRVNETEYTEVRIWEEVQTSMSPTEKRMNFDEWTAYCNQLTIYYDSLELVELRNLDAVAATQSIFTRSLILSGFGIYNCDQIERLKEPVTIYASFQNESGKKFTSKMTYVVDPNLNGILCYGDLYKGLSSKKFAVSNANKFFVITVDETGAMALASSEQMAQESFLNQRTYTFEMEALENVSMAELKTKIGL